MRKSGFISGLSLLMSFQLAFGPLAQRVFAQAQNDNSMRGLLEKVDAELAKDAGVNKWSMSLTSYRTNSNGQLAKSSEPVSSGNIVTALAKALEGAVLKEPVTIEAVSPETEATVVSSNQKVNVGRFELHIRPVIDSKSKPEKGLVTFNVSINSLKYSEAKSSRQIQLDFSDPKNAEDNILNLGKTIKSVIASVEKRLAKEVVALNNSAQPRSWFAKVYDFIFPSAHAQEITISLGTDTIAGIFMVIKVAVILAIVVGVVIHEVKKEKNRDISDIIFSAGIEALVGSMIAFFGLDVIEGLIRDTLKNK